MSYLWYFTGGDDGAHPSTGVTFRPRKLLLGTDTTGDGRIYPLKPGAAGSTTAVERTLFNFSGGASGAKPTGDLLAGPNGIYYGSASAGGAYGAGTIYQLTP